MLKVTVIDGGYEDYTIEQSVLEQVGASIEEVPCSGDLSKIASATRSADAVLVRESPLTKEIIDAMDKCKVIVRYGAGVDNINLQAAADREIYVANVPDYGFEEVSDHALALLMSVARRTVGRDPAVRNGAWNVSRQEPMYRIHGGVLGLVGYGRIAQAFHRKAKGLGFSRTLVVDKYLEQAPEGVELVDIDTLCKESDVVSLHAPLTDETYHLINEARLQTMKANAIVVNTARGGLIDEVALAASLKVGQIYGAGIDVFEEEPVSPDNPLLTAPNVVISDHTGWYSEQSVIDLQRKAAEEIHRVFSGQEPVHWLNRW